MFFFLLEHTLTLTHTHFLKRFISLVLVKTRDRDKYEDGLSHMNLRLFILSDTIRYPLSCGCLLLYASIHLALKYNKSQIVDWIIAFISTHLPYYIMFCTIQNSYMLIKHSSIDVRKCWESCQSLRAALKLMARSVSEISGSKWICLFQNMVQKCRSWNVSRLWCKVLIPI